MPNLIDPDALAESAARYLEEVIPGWDSLLGSDQLGHMSDLVIWTMRRRLQVESTKADFNARLGEPL